MSIKLIKVIPSTVLLAIIGILTYLQFESSSEIVLRRRDIPFSNDIVHEYQYLYQHNIENIHLINFYSDETNAGSKLYNYLKYVSTEFSNVTMVSLLNRDIKPKAIHSHNDYTRKIPLFQALSLGLTSIEADVWLTNNNHNLSVAHKKSELSYKKNNDLNKLYLNPILEMLDEVNNDSSSRSIKKGLYYENTNRTMFLLIDFKSEESTETYIELMKNYLKPLIEKDYLTSFDISNNQMSWKPVTIILTGNKPTDLAIIDNDDISAGQGFFEDGKRYVFPEAILDDLSNLKEESQSLLSSTSFARLCHDCNTASWKVRVRGKLSNSEIVCFKRFIDDAHRKNLKTRIWGVPESPNMLGKNLLQQQIDRIGVDFINVDNISKFVGSQQTYKDNLASN